MDKPYEPFTPELDETLLPVYQANKDWIEGGLWSYLNFRAEYDLAAAFSKLFWPDFVEVDGCILLKDRYSPGNFEQWMKHSHGKRQDVEAMINHTHMGDLFLNSSGVLANEPLAKDLHADLYPDALYDYLAKILLVCWKHALMEAFPDKHFTFHYNEEREVITFHQGECN